MLPNPQPIPGQCSFRRVAVGAWVRRAVGGRLGISLSAELVVTGVDAGGPFARAGVRSGWALRAVAGEAVIEADKVFDPEHGVRPPVLYSYCTSRRTVRVPDLKYQIKISFPLVGNEGLVIHPGEPERSRLHEGIFGRSSAGIPGVFAVVRATPG